jgi:hypothetical protein
MKIFPHFWKGKKATNLKVKIFRRGLVRTSVARWYIFKPKMRNLGKFCSVLQWKMLVNFIDSSSILLPFGKFYGHLVYFWVIWYIFVFFGMLYLVKCGNPGENVPHFFATGCSAASTWKIYFSQKHTMTMHIKFWQQHSNVSRPKNLTPWRDSNLGSSGLEADAMTTMSRRQGASIYLESSSSPCL